MRLSIKLTIGIILLIACGIMIRAWNISPSNLSRVQSEIELSHNEIINEINYDMDLFYHKVSEIESIALNVSNNNVYSRKYPRIFDCTDFSKELIRQLNESGYKAKCVFGTYKKKLHTWVIVSMNYGYYIEMPIEATYGFMISYNDYIENYQKLSEGRCI